MANEVNDVSVKGVSTTSGYSVNTEATQENNRKIQTFNYSAKDDGKGTTVGSSGGDFNTYGKDVTNFEKFKGNDKHDAMRATNQAANDVKVAYMQLQHDFPDVVVQFEPMPDPRSCGKKREGFITYSQLLENWKDNSLLLINNARSTGTRSEVRNAAGVIMANDDANAAMNAAVTVSTGEAVAEFVDRKGNEINANVDREGAATRNVVRSEAQTTRNVVHGEAQATRNAVHAEGAITRNTVRAEGARTRNVVRDEAFETRNTVREEAVNTRETVRDNAQETQELEALSNKLSDVLSNSWDKPHTNETISLVGSIRDEILASNLSHENKKALLNDLVNWSNQAIITNEEIKNKRNEVRSTLALGIDSSEAPNYEEPPYNETPHYEVPYREGEPFGAPTTKDSDKKEPSSNKTNENNIIPNAIKEEKVKKYKKE